MFEDYRFLPIEQQEPVEEETDDCTIEEEFLQQKKTKKPFISRKKQLYTAS